MENPSPKINLPDAITTATAAKMLDVTEQSVRRYVNEGILTNVRRHGLGERAPLILSRSEILQKMDRPI
jgi:hypothetical protein